MQRAALSILSLILFTGFTLLGCGSGGEGDVLDENEQRYTADVSFSDADEDNILTIDVLQQMCDTEPEIFTDVLATISLDISPGAPGLTLESYSIEFIPVASSDTNDQQVMPPDLADPEEGFYTFSVPSGGSSEFTITLMRIDTKDFYLQQWLSDPALANLVVARYRIRIELHFVDEYGVDRDIELDRTVFLSNYDNC